MDPESIEGESNGDPGENDWSDWPKDRRVTLELMDNASSGNKVVGKRNGGSMGGNSSFKAEREGVVAAELPSSNNDGTLYEGLCQYKER